MLVYKTIILTIISVIILFLILGPRIKFTNSFEKVNLPSELSKLDDYLKISEAEYNLAPNSSKEIIWREPFKKTKYSIIFFHGFSATKKSLDPISINIAKAINANLFYTRLKGHGIDERDAFKGVKVEDWLKDIDEAIQIGKMIGEKLILIGSSNGGSAVIWANNEYKNDILANILISPNIEPKDKKAKLIYYPWGREMAYLVTGGYNSFNIKKESRKPYVIEQSFFSKEQHIDAVIALMGLVKLNREFRIKNIKSPTLVFHTYNDNIVNSKATRKFIREYSLIIKNMPVITLENNSSHILAGNLRYDTAQNTGYVVKYTINFIEELER